MKQQKEQEYDFNQIEMADPENFSFGSKDATFNHAILVMRAYQKAQDCLAKEKIEGFWETRTDVRGNPISIYHPDTRKEAMESVKTLVSCMAADIKGTTEKKNIEILLEHIEEEYEKYVGIQLQWWKQLNNDERIANKDFFGSVKAGRLFIKGNFYQEYLNLSMDVYREIFEQLEFVLGKIRYFKKKAVQA